jgi:hypothetical protein
MWRLLLGSRTIIRVSVLSLIVGAAIVIGLKMAIPMIQLPPLWNMLLALPTLYACFLVMLLVHAAIPSRIQVRDDRIQVMTGQSHWVVKSEAIQGTRIVIFALDRIRLRVFYLHKDRLWSQTFAVSPKVELDALSKSFAVYPQIWDARNRYKDPRGFTT